MVTAEAVSEKKSLNALISFELAEKEPFALTRSNPFTIEILTISIGPIKIEIICKTQDYLNSKAFDFY